MRMFFLMSIGRSGSKFLANLLNTDQRGVVLHLPNHFDKHLISMQYSGSMNNVSSLYLKKRFKELLDQYCNKIFYGEVNSYLRFSIDWLKENYNPQFIHIVRDGRDFVRSVYMRKVFTQDEYSMPLFPKDSDSFSTKWFSLSRFEQLCWYWKFTNEYLANKINNYVKFENLISDYTEFQTKVAKPLLINIDKTTWLNHYLVPLNSSRRILFNKKMKNIFMPWTKKRVLHTIPQWKDWDINMTNTFWNICEDTMNHFGYYK